VKGDKGLFSETGILAVLNNVDSKHRAECAEWYQKEHVPNWCAFVKGVEGESVGVLERKLQITSLFEQGATNDEFLPRYELLYALRA
jgi:hypothetical protein